MKKDNLKIVKIDKSKRKENYRKRKNFSLMANTKSAYSFAGKKQKLEQNLKDKNINLS